MRSVVLCCLLVAAAVLAWPHQGGPWPARVRGGGEGADDASGRSTRAGPASSGGWSDGSRSGGGASGGTRGGGARGGGGWGARPARTRRLRDEALAELLELVIGPLRSGAPPASALDAARSALGPGPLDDLVLDLVGASHRAEPLAPLWATWSDRLDSDELRFVSRAWALTEETGAPLADALTSSLEVVRAHRRAADRVASAAAGPRASMLVLLLLPLSGPLVGLACGIGPRTLYLSSPAATASLLAGVALALLARWWSARILARAA